MPHIYDNSHDVVMQKSAATRCVHMQRPPGTYAAVSANPNL